MTAAELKTEINQRIQAIRIITAAEYNVGNDKAAFESARETKRVLLPGMLREFAELMSAHGFVRTGRCEGFTGRHGFVSAFRRDGELEYCFTPAAEVKARAKKSARGLANDMAMAMEL